MAALPREMNQTARIAGSVQWRGAKKTQRCEQTHSRATKAGLNLPALSKSGTLYNYEISQTACQSPSPMFGRIAESVFVRFSRTQGNGDAPSGARRLAPTRAAILTRACSAP
jgi:hypothetical protein